MVRLNLKPQQPKNYALIDPAHLDFSPQEMTRLAGETILSIRKRLLLGRGTDDRPMKPLSAAYRARKAKMGKPGRRDMMLSGTMLGALVPIEPDVNHISVGFTRRSEQEKAVANQNRDEWFGLSNTDDERVTRLADRMLRQKAQS